LESIVDPRGTELIFSERASILSCDTYVEVSDEYYPYDRTPAHQVDVEAPQFIAANNLPRNAPEQQGE